MDENTKSTPAARRIAKSLTAARRFALSMEKPSEAYRLGLVQRRVLVALQDMGLLDESFRHTDLGWRVLEHMPR